MALAIKTRITSPTTILNIQIPTVFVDNPQRDRKAKVIMVPVKMGSTKQNRMTLIVIYERWNRPAIPIMSPTQRMNNPSNIITCRLVFKTAGPRLPFTPHNPGPLSAVRIELSCFLTVSSV